MLIAILNYIYFKYIHIVEGFSIVENSVLWFLFGTVFVFYNYANLSNKLKKSLTIITTILITIYFVITYYPLVGPTVWTYSFIILLISLIRNENSSLSKEAALEEIKNNAGTQFDENIVKIFVESIQKEINIIL